LESHLSEDYLEAIVRRSVGPLTEQFNLEISHKSQIIKIHHNHSQSGRKNRWVITSVLPVADGRTPISYLPGRPFTTPAHLCLPLARRPADAAFATQVVNLNAQFVHRVVRSRDCGEQRIVNGEAKLFHATAKAEEIVAVWVQRVAQLPRLSF